MEISEVGCSLTYDGGLDFSTYFITLRILPNLWGFGRTENEPDPFVTY